MKILASIMFIALLDQVIGSLEPLGYQPPSHHYLQPPQYQRSPYKDFRSPSNTYLPASSSSSTYLPPSSNTYLPPNQNVEVFDSRYTNPPSTSYGVPDFNSAVRQQRGYTYSRPREEQYNNEPAKYEFGYKVRDARGSDYGHQESRNGAKTRGRYYVMLPDGRRQVVEYEADEAGYRPKITYEEVAPGYGRSSTGSSGGYTY